MNKIRPNRRKPSPIPEVLLWILTATFAISAAQASDLGYKLVMFGIALGMSMWATKLFIRNHRLVKPVSANTKYKLILVVCLAFAFSGVFLAIVSAGEHWNGKITMLGFTVCLIAVGKAVSLPEFPAWERAYNQRMLERATLAEIKARRTNNTRK